jgi:uncharacterized protein (DUF2267 family)
MAEQLPAHLGQALIDAPEGRDAFDSHIFFERVARRAGLTEDDAREEARAVLATLVEALPEAEVRYLRAALLAHYAALLEGQVLTKTDLSSV